MYSNPVRIYDNHDKGRPPFVVDYGGRMITLRERNHTTTTDRWATTPTGESAVSSGMPESDYTLTS